MKTRTITTTQLRGMIKEALEESLTEISLDEQIAALKAKGSKRTLQETKQYRRLLEDKMEMVRADMEGGEGTAEVGDLRADVEKALAAAEKSPLFQKRLEKVDQPLEMAELLSAMAVKFAGSESDAVKLLGKARAFIGQHTVEAAESVDEAEEKAPEEMPGGFQKGLVERRRVIRRR